MENINRKSLVFDIIKSALIAIVLSIAMTLILGVIIHFTSIGNSVIDIMNIAFRAVSIVVGLLLGIKTKENGMLKGLIVGLIYVLLTYITYGIVSGNFKVDVLKVIDSVTSLIFSIIGGIIAVNIKSRK